MPDLTEQVANKQFLRSIAANDYKIPREVDCFAFAQALLGNFASADGELRDDLSYMILASGILDAGKLTVSQLESLLALCLDKDHLFYCIGEVGKDSVFMRSFSALTINTILYADYANAQAPQLTNQSILKTKAALLHYAKEERDWRGYVEGKGWAHAMAHLADALDGCSQHHTMTQHDRREILAMVGYLAKRSDPLYHEEDVRLATVAYHMILAKQLDDDFLSEWVESCYVRRGADFASWMSVTNVKNFLRSLYFLLLWDSVALPLVEQIALILKKQDGLYIDTV